LSAAELGRAAWPVELLAAGMALMIAAANYAPLKVRLIAQAKIAQALGRLAPKTESRPGGRNHTGDRLS